MLFTKANVLIRATLLLSVPENLNYSVGVSFFFSTLSKEISYYSDNKAEFFIRVLKNT